MKYRILEGNAIDRLKDLDDDSVNCCVTSPPYWNLRDYGNEDQIGLEETPDEFIEKLVKVFSEVKRVLKNDGTLWVNIGDTYCSTSPNTMGDKLNIKGVSEQRGLASRKYRPPTPTGMKPKDLVGIPWILAFALRSDGWYLRQDIIWHKPNPMPESVKDRCTKAHEYIFLLAKSEKYYYDNSSIAEPVSHYSRFNGSQGGKSGANGDRNDKGRVNIPNKNNGSKNRRSVWSVATHPYRNAHFATFPEKLIEPCILAGCPDNGTVLDPFSGSGTTRVVAIKNNKNYIGIELNPEYIELSHKRIQESCGFLAEREDQ